MFFKAKKRVPQTKRKVLFPIRFSVLSNSKAWRASREHSFEQYKELLFSKERLDIKFHLFESLVLPNLEELESSTDSVEMQVLILTSSFLPEPYMAKLKALVAGKDFITLDFVDEKTKLREPLNQFVKSHTCSDTHHCAYATVRMDDDDLLCSDYLHSLTKFITLEFAGNIVSFSKGYESYYEFKNKRAEQNIKVSWPRIALGLAHINFYNADSASYVDKPLHIYDVGDHSKIDKNRSLITDNTPGMFLRMSYIEQDTQAKGIFDRIKRKDCALVDLDEVTNKFPLLKNILE